MLENRSHGPARATGPVHSEASPGPLAISVLPRSPPPGEGPRLCMGEAGAHHEWRAVPAQHQAAGPPGHQSSLINGATPTSPRLGLGSHGIGCAQVQEDVTWSGLQWTRAGWTHGASSEKSRWALPGALRAANGDPHAAFSLGDLVRPNIWARPWVATSSWGVSESTRVSPPVPSVPPRGRHMLCVPASVPRRKEQEWGVGLK